MTWACPYLLRFRQFNACSPLQPPLIAAGFVPAEPSGVKTGRRPPRGGVVLTLAAAGGYWAGGGWGAWDEVMGAAGEGSGLACAGGAGARPYLGPRDSCGLGDMMIDGVVPPGVWPRQSLEAVRARAVPGAASRTNPGRRPRGDGHGASVA